MPIRYCIHPELNMILYIGEGVVTAAEYFKTATIASQDPRRKWGMINIVDMLGAEEDFDLQDVRRAIEIGKSFFDRGLKLEPMAVLSYSTGVRLVADAVKLMSVDVKLEFEVYSSIEEMIEAMGYSSCKQELISFYEHCRYG